MSPLWVSPFAKVHLVVDGARNQVIALGIDDLVEDDLALMLGAISAIRSSSIKTSPSKTVPSLTIFAFFIKSCSWCWFIIG
jgi:hypothetical protein